MADPNIVTTTSSANRQPKRQQAEVNAELRAKAARQALKDATPAEPEQMVECRVLKRGDGKISTGQHIGGIGEVHYEKGETFMATRETAESYEEKAFVEIQ